MHTDPSQRREIGVFDSGVGGFTVLRELRTLLPTARLRYLADTAYAPYGNRSLDGMGCRRVAGDHDQVGAALSVETSGSPERLQAWMAAVLGWREAAVEGWKPSGA